LQPGVAGGCPQVVVTGWEACNEAVPVGLLLQPACGIIALPLILGGEFSGRGESPHRR